ncbi:MAG: hypothetical protein AAF065_07655 [Verrucomicrobiota bacterium]
MPDIKPAALLLSSVIIALVLPLFLLSPAQIQWVLQYCTYWVILALLVFFILGLVRLSYDPNVRDDWLECFRPLQLLFIVGMSWLMISLQPTGYKVVMDEPVLIVTAQQMHQEKQFLVPYSCYELGGVFYTFDGYVDKRPGFYVFLVSLLHDLTGYRTSQGFVLNHLLVVIFIALLAVVGRKLWPALGFFVAPLLVLTVPLFSISANGSGFDFLNVLMVLATVYLGAIYYNSPSEERMNLCILSAALLAHTRYESAMYAVPIGLLVILGWLRTRRILVSYTTSLIPLAFSPLLMLQLMIRSTPEHWQIRGESGEPFSLTYLGENLEAAANFFYQFGPNQPNSFYVSALFVILLITCLLRWPSLRNRLADFKPPEGWPAYLLLGFGATGLLGLLMFYHWGQLDDSAASRLAMPFILMQILTITYLSSLVFQVRLSGLIFVACAVFYFMGVSRPVCASTSFLSTYPSVRQAIWTREKVIEHRDEPALFVLQQRLIPVGERKSGLEIRTAIERKAQLALHLELQTFSEVYLFFTQDRTDTGTGDYTRFELGSHFEYEVIESQRLDRIREVFMAKLIRVKLDDDTNPYESLKVFDGIDKPAEWSALHLSTLP